MRNGKFVFREEIVALMMGTLAITMIATVVVFLHMVAVLLHM